MDKDPRLRAAHRSSIASVSTSRRRFVQSALALIVATPTVAAAQEGPEAVAAPVERLHDALLNAAREGETPEARFERLSPVVAAVFDFTTMSRVAVGSAWGDFTPAERRAVEERFAAYAAANYAENFDDASGLAFRTVDVETGEGPRLRVVTELARPNKEPVVFDYLVQRTDAGPRIVNVVVDGTMNELARRRAEFRALLEAGGLSNLLDTLEAQTRSVIG